MFKNKKPSACAFREKQILCGACTRSSCRYPNESPDVWNPSHKDEYWRYACGITNSTCKGDCYSNVTKKIEELRESNQYMLNKIQKNKSEIMKLKVEFE